MADGGGPIGGAKLIVGGAKLIDPRDGGELPSDRENCSPLIDCNSKKVSPKNLGVHRLHK